MGVCAMKFDASKIDDDVFEYEGGMRQCISGFGNNAKECVDQLINNRYSDAAHNALNWHIKELVRWCRSLNREAQEIRLHNERLIEELLTNGSGWDRESLLAFIRNPPPKTERHERNTITCPCCGEKTVVDTRCVEDCDECGVAIAYSVRPYSERAT